MTISLDVFHSVKNLPSPPEHINNVLVASGSTSSMDYNIVEIIQYDPSMALSVLKVANSPVYGYPAQIFSLQQAAGLLGPGAIKNIILRTPILEKYLAEQESEFALDYEELWMHCGVTASLAGGLGRLIGGLESDVCFTAGLIHDAGVIALSVYYPREMSEAVGKSRNEKINLLNAEKKVFGFDSSQVSMELMTAWNFPESFINLFRSDIPIDEADPSSKTGAVVGLAKLLSREWSLHVCSHVPDDLDGGKLLHVLGITPQNISHWEPELKKYAGFATGTLKGNN
ncbi:MAG: HDOD domain-containing protein [Nitrospinae bacterium]|nr:HDOD domain-containing protein [Nitrospinota bacterium]